MNVCIDLYLAAVLDGQITEIPEELELPMELYLMDSIAIKHAGGDHMVHWNAAGDYQ